MSPMTTPRSRTLMAPPSAMSAFYGGSDVQRGALQANRSVLSSLELEAVSALQGMLGAPALEFAKENNNVPAQPSGKIMEVPAHSYGYLEAAYTSKKRDSSHLALEGLVSLAKATNFMREKENSASVASPLKRIKTEHSDAKLAQAKLENLVANVLITQALAVAAPLTASKQIIAPTEPVAPVASVTPEATVGRTSPPLIESVTVTPERVESPSTDGDVDADSSAEPLSESLNKEAPKVAKTHKAASASAAKEGKSRYSAFRKASTCPFCAQIGLNCGRVAAKCPNRPCNKCNRRHRLNRCKRTHCKHCKSEEHLSSKCPVKLREWARASVARRRKQRLDKSTEAGSVSI